MKKKCGVPPVCVFGRKGPNCDQPDCSPCQGTLTKRYRNQPRPQDLARNMHERILEPRVRIPPMYEVTLFDLLQRIIFSYCAINRCSQSLKTAYQSSF